MSGIGSRIKKRREELGLSQTQLAKRAGYADKTGISKIESEDRKLNIDKIQKFADALGVSFSYLVGDEESTKKKKPLRFIITIEELDE